ncbi:Zn-ribbon domain-containing OB-fold protein [Microbulbifer agarilyticus]|uniref:Zn-ribbon domain-containing OB-fold protein n=1 Tax=Microbulbifer agarilyticus TaxID=260552 RepID=UPI001CD23E57|nr:OB-fold domain-containing protein [Microbulbifer agarilyticus]MCA0892416.1 OB-fold domain-containing protein [Microbulbifer agarilyticus]
MYKNTPIAEGLFTWPSKEPALLGSRCQQCNIAEFPQKPSCPACGSVDVQVEELPRRGTLWTWTIQGFMPKKPYRSDETPETFTPYGVGYIELPGAVCVESRLLENSPEKLKIGMEMELVVETFRHDESGNPVMSFAFKAVE